MSFDLRESLANSILQMLIQTHWELQKNVLTQWGKVIRMEEREREGKRNLVRRMGSLGKVRGRVGTTIWAWRGVIGQLGSVYRLGSFLRKVFAMDIFFTMVEREKGDIG